MGMKRIRPLVSRTSVILAVLNGHHARCRATPAGAAGRTPGLDKAGENTDILAS